MPFDNQCIIGAPMLVPCEIAVKCVLPVIRAMLAKELTARGDLNQAEAATILGISQPAISLYCRNRRGKAINLESNEQIVAMVRNMAHVLVKDHSSKSKIVRMYCDICETIRSRGLMCELHKALDPNTRIEECEFCLMKTPPKCL